MTRSSLRCRWSDEESVSQTWRWEALTHSLAVGAAARSCRRHVFDSGSVWFTAGVRSDESLDFSDRTCSRRMTSEEYYETYRRLFIENNLPPRHFLGVSSSSSVQLGDFDSAVRSSVPERRREEEDEKPSGGRTNQRQRPSGRKSKPPSELHKAGECVSACGQLVRPPSL
ncbi:Hypothetical protein SMAX5B_015374 [Scophthalmus maximus]|uniref:Uncharacterized protein n=1 Tax=Scophthalmus maximus TaxID=52904 RepID=A0A2U9BYS3_SCOMX|nr:Hypothetical protein SMAX5B_015374 [Scophthalmus maximus]